MGKPGKTGRKELLMDAKEKLRLMNVIAGKLKGEVVVIDPESFRKEPNMKSMLQVLPMQRYFPAISSFILQKRRLKDLRIWQIPWR